MQHKKEIDERIISIVENVKFELYDVHSSSILFLLYISYFILNWKILKNYKKTILRTSSITKVF